MKICEIYKLRFYIFQIFSVENLGLPTQVNFHLHEITGSYAKESSLSRKFSELRVQREILLNFAEFREITRNYRNFNFA